HVSISNGRGSVSNIQDLDNNKALGARVYYETRELGDLTVGLSGYMGRSTDRIFSIDVGSPPARVSTEPTTQFDEQSLGVDLRWSFEGFYLAAEYIQNDVAFTERGRPTTAEFWPFVGTDLQRQPDFRRWGAYGLVGYRIESIGLMPYALIERVDYGRSNPFEGIENWNFGLNWQITPYVVAKFELNRVELFGGATAELIAGEDFWGINSQIAWSF
ncbi:MAG: hypothetical protein AAF658_16950, partial [Myxococcota bacterium]